MRLIDADALFLHLRGNRGKETGSYSKGRNNGINIAIGAIRNEQICPTVDAVPVVHGRWLKTQEPLSWIDVDCIECSNCHESWIIDEDCGFSDLADSWKYCPNCGAKMDGGNEE